MSVPDQPAPPGGPPAWAIREATSELWDEHDRAVVISRAWEIVRAAAVREDERHDEFDDPDQGGEA